MIWEENGKMIRILTVVMAVWLTSYSAAAQDADQRRTLIKALASAGSGDWTTVDALRQAISDSAARDVVEWMRLRGRQGTFSECLDFLQRNGDWPGLPLLMQRCELSIARGSNPDNVLAFFSKGAPQTGTGSLRYAEALYRKDRDDEARAELRRAWVTFSMSRSEHDAFVTRNGDTISDLHIERTDMLLWKGSVNASKRMLPLVGKGWPALAQARLGLRAKAGNVDTLIAAVPTSLRDDPGLAYERFLWRKRKGRDESAIELMLDRSVSSDSLGQPERWAGQRRSLARQLMRDGDPVAAYALASAHFLTSGSDFADLEWLSGFLALRKLNSPVQAVAHFEAFRNAVATPISLGRAGYWLGLAYEAAGDGEKAEEAFSFGARYQSSFYGQLAAEKGGVATDPNMIGAETFPDWREAEFVESSVFKAAQRLQEAGLRDLAERFLVHLAETQDRTGLGQLGDFALELNEPHIALMISKQAARMGYELYKTYFPLGPPNGQQVPVDMELALAIARRESEFDPQVMSPVGARGLMQLMPGTAKEVSSKLKEPYVKSRLLSDPLYNARLGTAYLAQLLDEFNGNPVLVSIGYNAGPSRARRWPKEYGDPRTLEVDIIDWIEGIPFRETRNYVMRVTESFAPYRARLEGKVEPIQLSKELVR